MKRLKLLGGALLESGDDAGGAITGRAVQRRRIALLALLVMRQQGVSRDKIIAYLWPDSDSERGRHLLSDSVYRVNQELGANTITAVGDDLRLDCDALSCDVLEFERAVEARDHARAAGVYAGPFLDGFFLSECVELERWIEGERARLGRSYQEAIESLADAAGAAGEHARAVEWWRRAAALDPYNSRIALRLMQALAASGNRPGALQHAQIHAALVRSDFGTEPDASVVEYAERLRKGENQAPAPATATAPPRVGPPNEEYVAAAAAQAAAPHTPRRRTAILAAAAAAVAVVLLVVFVWPAREPSSVGDVAGNDAGEPPHSVAVLPFTNLSGDAADEYFADGMTDELIAALDRVPGLHVAARTSSFVYKGQNVDIRDVAQRLGVATVVEGSVRKDGRRLRIAARLIDASNGYRLWSDDYDHEMRDVLTVQSEIAGAIAAALRQQIAPEPNEEQQRRDIARDPEAYELFLKGRYAWHRRTEQSLREAREYFEAAVARVPSYARAWTGLADAYAVSAFYDYVPPREGYPRAEEAARRALALDSTLAAPHATLGYVNLYHHWNWKAAEDEFRLAIRLAPEYSTAHQWYGNFLTAMGRFDEAKAAFARATEAEPLSLIASAASGWSRMYARDYDGAEAHFTRTLELQPDYELAHLWRGQALVARGKPEDALSPLQRAVDLSQRSSLTLAALAQALASARQVDSARFIVAEIEGRSPARYVPPYEIAKVHLALGDTVRALEWFDRAYRERAHSMVFLKVDPHLAGMERQPRYAALLRRIALN